MPTIASAASAAAASPRLSVAVSAAAAQFARAIVARSTAPNRGPTIRSAMIQASAVKRAAIAKPNHQLPSGFIVQSGSMTRAPVSVMPKIEHIVLTGEKIAGQAHAGTGKTDREA